MKWLDARKNLIKREQVLAWNGISYFVGDLFIDSNGIITCESSHGVLMNVLKFTKIIQPWICEGDNVVCYGGLSTEFCGEVIKQKTYTHYIVEDEVTGQKFQVSHYNIVKI